MKPLYLEQIQENAHCDDCAEAGRPDHSHGELFIHGSCHPKIGVAAMLKLAEGVVEFSCPECQKPIMTIKIGSKFPPTPIPKEILDLCGPTGEVTQEQLDSDEEGALQFAVGHFKGDVILDFGTSVKWVGMSAPLATNLAHSLLQHASEADISSGKKQAN